MSSATYIIHLRESVATLATRVVIMETRVMPVLEQRGDVAVLTAQADLQDERIEILEGRFHQADKHVDEPPIPVPKRKR